MPDITYYDILQIRPNATDDIIRLAYRRLAKRHHPDANPMNPGLAATRFRAIQDAYEHLRDPKKRSAYDQILKMNSWTPQKSANDHQPTAGLSDLFTTTRRTIERLMRLLATPNTRETRLSSAQQGKK